MCVSSVAYVLNIQMDAYIKKTQGTDFDYKENFFPSLHELHKIGVEFILFDQYPGDLVSAGAGAFHFVVKPVCEHHFFVLYWTSIDVDRRRLTLLNVICNCFFS